MLKKVTSILEKDHNVTIKQIKEKDNKILFELSLNKDKIEIYLIIGKDFPKSLPIIGINKSEFNYPHFLQGENFTYLCYSNRENLILNNATPKDVIDYTLSQIKRLLQLSTKEIENEFQKEFLYFFNDIADLYEKKIIELYVRPEESVEELKIEITDKKVIIRNTDLKLNKNYFKHGTNKNALYIPLNKNDEILPPECGETWNKEYLLKLLNENITWNNYKLLKKKYIKKRKIMTVFKMKLNTGFEIMFCIQINFKNKSKRGFIEKIKEDFDSILFYKSKRCDKKYLQQRIGSSLNFYNKNVLLVGCGSLGSYIAQELPKIGITKLTVVDHDIIKPGNISRHALGMFYKGQNKAKAIKLQLELSFPELLVEAIDNYFFKSLNKDLELDNFDLIIITTGGTDRQLKFNKYFSDNNIKIPVIFGWLEKLGVGSHILLTNYDKQGCFNCLCKDTEGNLVNNKAHFLKGEEKYDIMMGDGCGATFNPYGNTILLQATSLMIKIIIKLFNQEFINERNLLFSIKSLIERDLNYTERYKINSSDLTKGSNDYILKGCEFCGE